MQLFYILSYLKILNLSKRWKSGLNTIRSQLNVYLFNCTQFTNERLQMFHSTRNLHSLNCQLLLFGNEAQTAEQNIEIVEVVHKFIKRTKHLHNAFHPSTLPYFPHSFPSPSFILNCHSFRNPSFLSTSILSSSHYLCSLCFIYVRHI